MESHAEITNKEGIPSSPEGTVTDAPRKPRKPRARSEIVTSSTNESNRKGKVGYNPSLQLQKSRLNQRRRKKKRRKRKLKKTNLTRKAKSRKKRKRTKSPRKRLQKAIQQLTMKPILFPQLYFLLLINGLQGKYSHCLTIKRESKNAHRLETLIQCF